MRLHLYLLILAISLSAVFASVTEMTDKIVKDILKDYNSGSRPSGSVSDQGVSVSINVVPLHVQVNADTSTLNTHVWFVMQWEDSRLKWAATNYENVSKVHIQPEKLWRPDIMVYNSVEHFDYEKTEVLVLSNGNVWWVPPVNLHTSCALDWTYWPWDRQACSLIVGSWTKAGQELDIQNLGGANTTRVDQDNFTPAAWNIVAGVQRRRVNRDYGGTEDFFVDIAVELVLERRSLLDRKVAVLPLLCAASLLLASFWTPAASHARLRLNASCCLLLVISLLALRFMLPSAGGALPLVIQFTTGLVVLALIQLMLALALSNLLARADSPPAALSVILQRLAPFLCLGDLPLVGRLPSVTPPWAENPDTEGLQAEPVGGAGKPLSGWQLLAQVVDRIAFLVFFIIIFGFLATYLGKASLNLSTFPSPKY